LKPLHLADLSHPSELQDRSVEELDRLCAEIRTALIDKVRQTGGHLGSNLGVVELTVALHRVFDFLSDRLVFDVSHQCYPHKMLTGRYAQFDGLRQTGGISGFCNRAESPYDVLTAAHAGTAISFATGIAEGLRGSAPPGKHDPWTVALVGDAGLGAGVSFEGLSQAAERRPRLLIVLNDNEWSIARSVGALARYLSRIRSSRTLQVAYERLKELGQKLPLGDKIGELGEVLRHVLIPGHVFEELGINYVGPLDGHDLSGAIDTFERLKRLEGVTLVHFLTEKGRGYEAAKTDPQRAHGVSPPKLPSPADKAAAAEKPKRRSFTKIFGDELVRAAREDSRIIAITAAMPDGTGLTGFAEEFPNRFYDTGITEQHAVSLAGGLATAGKKPVAAIYSTFLQRGYDQVFQEIVLQNEDVVVCMDRAGVVGQDGPTHNGVFDLAYLRTIPGTMLASPRDATDLGRMLRAALARGGPWFLRWPRGSALEVLGAPPEMRPELVPGTAERMREGAHGAVFALGALVENALLAAEALAGEGIELEVWDARFCKPLDQGAVADIGRRHQWVATVEDHQLAGGFGSAVAEMLADLGLRPVISRHGYDDRFVEHASTREEQLHLQGLSPEALAEHWKASLARAGRLETEPARVQAP
jgi:1-deoxy-D-xylulose-5-phosphate synthase